MSCVRFLPRQHGEYCAEKRAKLARARTTDYAAAGLRSDAFAACGRSPTNIVGRFAQLRSFGKASLRIAE